MKKLIEINYGTSITVNRGNYENEKPMWHVKTTLELNGETPEQVDDIETKEFSRLKAKLDSFAQAEWDKAKLEQANLRIRIKDGKKYPSVTSILADSSFVPDPEYAIRGTEIHRLCELFIKSGKWDNPSAVLTKLRYDQIPYQKFFPKFAESLDFKGAIFNIECFNEKHLYSGEVDLICKVNGLQTLVDLKTGQWKWPQLTAYFKTDDMKKMAIEQLAVFDLKNGKLEILDPKTEKARDAWEDFLKSRGAFESRFGI